MIINKICNSCGSYFTSEIYGTDSSGEMVYCDKCSSPVEGVQGTKHPTGDVPQEIQESIEHTFNFLVYSKKKNSDNYCIHDIEDNCFDSVEQIQESVKKIVEQALAQERLRMERRLRSVFGLNLKILEEQPVKESHE